MVQGQGVIFTIKVIGILQFFMMKSVKYSKNKSFSYFEVSSILENLFQINAPIDVVDLNNCSARIADRVATEGILIYEIEERLFNNFKEKSLLSDEQKSYETGISTRN